MEGARSVAEITNLLSRLRARAESERQMQRELDPWRYLEFDRLDEIIWAHVPDEEERGETIVKPDIAAVTDTLVAVTTTRPPQVEVIPKNRSSAERFKEANFSERLIGNMWVMIDGEAEESTSNLTAEDMYHRGKGALKILGRNPAERGEIRRPAQALELYDPNVQLTENGERITEEGGLPVCIERVDPMDLFTLVNPRSGEIEVGIHEFYEPAETLAHMLPELARHPTVGPLLKPSTGGLAADLKVIDYWDAKVNAIIIEGHFVKEPTPHGYGCTPFVVAAGRYRNRKVGERTYREAVPFCWNMLRAVHDLSYASSMMATNMREVAFSKLVQWGVPADGRTPWAQPIKDANDVVIGIENRMDLNLSPDSRVIQAYVYETARGELIQERLEYMQPPRMTEQWMAFTAERHGDIEITGISRPLLSGAYNVDLSGIAYSLMRQLSVARMAQYIRALDRLWSKAWTRAFKLIASEWERDGRGSVPMQLQGLTGESEVELSLELVRSVAEIRVRFQPDLPDNRAEEINNNMSRVMSKQLSYTTAMDLAGDIQDPDFEWKKILFEGEVLENPIYRKLIALQFAKDQNLLPNYNELEAELAVMQQQQQMATQELLAAGQAAGAGPQPQPPDPTGAMGGGGPVPPSATPSPMAPVVPGASEPSPEMLALLMQQMLGAGAPAAGGPPMPVAPPPPLPIG